MVWSGWLKISHAKDSKVGVLQREKELRLLKHRQEELHVEIAEFEDQLAATETELKEAEIMRESIQQHDNKLGSELSLKSAEFSAYSTRWEHQQRRLKHIAIDLEEIIRETGENAEVIAESRLLQEEAENYWPSRSKTSANWKPPISFCKHSKMIQSGPLMKRDNRFTV